MDCTDWCVIGSNSSPGPGICYNGPPNAPNSSEKHRRVRITHAFHPLCGQEFDLIEHKSVFGVSYLFFCHPSGHLRQIPPVSTDFLKTDALVQAPAGRSTVHADFLPTSASVPKKLGIVFSWRGTCSTPSI